MGSRGFRPFAEIPHSLWGIARLAWWLFKYRADVVHGLLYWAYVIGAIVARLTGVPAFIASRRSLGTFKEGHRALLALEWVANRVTDLVVANSEAVRADVLRQERLAPGRVIVIPNGVDLGRFSGPFRDVRTALGIPRDARTVGVIANLIHYKGHLTFLEAWESVARSYRNAHALLVGDGPMRSTLENRARELGLAQSVHFLGRRTDVPALLATMDVVAHPSDEEGFSNAILEAMAAGRPLVATAVGGTADAVTDGQTGLLVRPRDPAGLAQAIMELLASPARAAELGAAARERVRLQYDLDVMVRRYQELYERVVAKSGRTSMSTQ